MFLNYILHSSLFTFHSEFISQIKEEVWFLGVVAIAESGTKGTKDGIVVIGYLPAQQCTVIKYLFQLVGLLASGKT